MTARVATGIARAAVGQVIGIPNAIAASRIVNVLITIVSRTGKTIIEIVLSTGPNGDTTSRSNVPATSSWRTAPGGVVSVEVSTCRLTMPTTTNAK